MIVEEVKQKARDVVLALLPDANYELLLDDSDIFTLGLDSINAMALIFNLQDTFDIKFETSEINFDNFRTFTDIVNLITRKKEKN
ncbi:acyl carrier protein [Chroogloeocystis siderophila]|jgi:acyl carrier protein|uniref:Phosphopantetheine attachment site protein n=1 Tax=Chroogloeocystis siderophila 5.2 s.c.1 TaxID=247279 RepID=A0A1U7HFF7_9CHRO|nr:acyl carrier protein [Chroogloeocystis siderophila]OKH22294.1 phosphopantetheine attachment site protein [Chroogloeocystis siderophila 5.2 s.c.1]